MSPRPLKKYDVVQLSHETKNPAFIACFMVVDEPKSFGAMGYVQCLGENRQMGGRAYYRASFEEMEYIGEALFVPQEL